MTVAEIRFYETECIPYKRYPFFVLSNRACYDSNTPHVAGATGPVTSGLPTLKGAPLGKQYQYRYDGYYETPSFSDVDRQHYGESIYPRFCQDCRVKPSLGGWSFPATHLQMEQDDGAVYQCLWRTEAASLQCDYHLDDDIF